MQGSLFAFPDGLFAVNFCMPLKPPSSLPFPSPFEVRCGEPVREGERNRPLPLPFLFGSCVKAHESPNEHWPLVIQRVQSPLSELSFLHCISLFLSFSLCSELQMQACPRPDLSL